jgi:hypothetical protein
MVPGMTERERLAANVQRLEWLPDASLGPTHLPRPPGPPAVPSGTRHSVPLGLCRRGLVLAHGLSQRIRTIRSRTVWSLPSHATDHPIAEQRPST